MQVTNEQLLDLIEELLELPIAKEKLHYLMLGVGTATKDKVWLQLRNVLRDAGRLNKR